MHLFIVQLEPDIDHLAPVAYELARRNNSKVMIAGVNGMYSLEEDYRLTYLRNEFNVKIEYLHDIVRGIYWKHILNRFMMKLPRRILSKFNKKYWKSIYVESIGISISSVNEFFKKMAIKTITIDDALPIETGKVLYEAAKILNIPIIKICTGAKVLKVPEKGYKLINSNYYITSHTLLQSADPYQSSVQVLGCSRYAREWQRVKSLLEMKLFPDDKFPQANGKLKVLIIASPVRKFPAGHATMKRIGQLDYVEVLLKNKSRMVMPSSLVNVGYDVYPTSRCIQWADVVICSISSVVCI